MLRKMEFAQAQVKIMILDACRNDFEELRGGDEPRGLAEMTASGVIVSYAASPGRPANANPGEHGVYTAHLLAALQQAAQLPVELLFKQVSNSVYQETNRRGAPQEPWTGGNLRDTFCFDPQNRCAGFLPQSTAAPQVVYVEVTPRPEPTRKIATPVPLPTVSTRLRSTPQTISDNNEAMRLFDVQVVDGYWRPRQYVTNKFERRGDVVIDHATGLTWQQSGSSKYMTYADAQKYISQLNREGFGGDSGWRLPTVNELLSLMESQENSDGLYIDPVFNKSQRWGWSSDKRSSESAWGVHFNGGDVGWPAWATTAVSAQCVLTILLHGYFLGRMKREDNNEQGHGTKPGRPHRFSETCEVLETGRNRRVSGRFRSFRSFLRCCAA